MKNKAKLITGLLLLTSSLSLSSCNAVSLSIKSKGELVSASTWGKSFIESYDENLGVFQDRWFDAYALLSSGTLSTSYTIKTIKQTTSTVITKALNTKSKDLKVKTDEKETATSIYDYDNKAYNQNINSVNTKTTHNGVSYSNSENVKQVQMFEKKLYEFDMIEKTYAEVPTYSDVGQYALSDEYACELYIAIVSAYNFITLSGDGFGNEDIYANAKFFKKGNVFTIIDTRNYADTFIDPSKYSEISGTVEYTRQYILEKDNIAYTELADYKKCVTYDIDNEYKNTLKKESGKTYKVKLKGNLNKVYRDDYTFKNLF